jgi:hypothetical protein
MQMKGLPYGLQGPKRLGQIPLDNVTKLDTLKQLHL